MVFKELQGEFTPLLESNTTAGGIIPILIISPGWGSSGYYSPAVLLEAASQYVAGTQMYWDRPSRSEEKDRPERSLHALAGVLIEAGHYEANGPRGPGIYARARVFSQYRESIREFGSFIGVSHYANGTSHHGEAEGQAGEIIDQITEVRSVDFVTQAGRGGAVFEAARSLGRAPAPTGPTLTEAAAELRDAYILAGMSEATATQLAQDLVPGGLRESGPEESDAADGLTPAERELVDAYVTGGMVRETAIDLVRDLRRFY